MTAPPLLEVEDLRVELASEAGAVRAVDGVTFTVRPGEAVALVGESGSGKSITALSILRLVPEPPARVTGGVIRFMGQEVLDLAGPALRQLRGGRIGLVFQEPQSALNPVLTVGRQLMESVQLHRAARRSEARALARAVLEEVGIADAERQLDAYPHQLSGGMQQRVLIAMALISEPALLVADEPTSALDTTTQAQVMALLRRVRERRGVGLLLITHDLGLVAESCDRVVVMYAGQVVESAPVQACFTAPAHPYTAMLLEAARTLASGGTGRHSREPVPRTEPRQARGCPFRPRCRRRKGVCKAERPELQPRGERHAVRCFNPRPPASEEP